MIVFNKAVLFFASTKSGTGQVVERGVTMQANQVSERYKYPVSDGELARRLKNVQEQMKADGVDCVLTQTQSGIFDRGIRYFIDQQTGSYSSALLIPAEGKMALLMHGNDCDSAPIPPWGRNVGKVITKPFCQPFAFTDDMAGNVMAAEIAALGARKVGLFCRQCMSLAFGDALRAALPDVEFVDYSVTISRLSAVKSAEEWELIDKSIRAHEQLMAMVPALIRPGKMEFEVRAELEKMALSMGCDTIGNVAVGSAPKGGMSMFVPHFSENRRIQMGDTVTVMVEVAGPGGMFAELARTFCLGEPNQSLLDLYEVAKSAQTAVAAAAKPGATGADLTRVFDEFVTAHGIAPNARFVGHGQGYDMMESPAICGSEDMVLEEDMYFAIHPELVRDGEFSICCDNFRITKEGAVRITRTPQQITMLEF